VFQIHDAVRQASSEEVPIANGLPAYRAVMRTPFPPVVGTVETWYDERGWGVLRTPDGLSVFCHFSDVEVDGYVELSVGESIWFDYETPGQDGCDARVRTAARSGVADSEIPLGKKRRNKQNLPSTAIRSSLTVTITHPDGRTETFTDDS